MRISKLAVSGIGRSGAQAHHLSNIGVSSRAAGGLEQASDRPGSALKKTIRAGRPEIDKKLKLLIFDI